MSSIQIPELKDAQQRPGTPRKGMPIGAQECPTATKITHVHPRSPSKQPGTPRRSHTRSRAPRYVSPKKHTPRSKRDPEPRSAQQRPGTHKKGTPRGAQRCPTAARIAHVHPGPPGKRPGAPKNSRPHKISHAQIHPKSPNHAKIQKPAGNTRLQT